jgi:hypothetical protein
VAGKFIPALTQRERNQHSDAGQTEDVHSGDHQQELILA